MQEAPEQDRSEREHEWTVISVQPDTGQVYGDQAFARTAVQAFAQVCAQRLLDNEEDGEENDFTLVAAIRGGHSVHTPTAVGSAVSATTYSTTGA